MATMNGTGRNAAAVKAEMDAVRAEYKARMDALREELATMTRLPKCAYCGCAVRNADACGMDGHADHLCRRCQKEISSDEV